MSEKLTNFLIKHKTYNKVTFTHTSMSGGSYSISKDDLSMFYKVYAEAIDANDTEFHLTERHIPNVGPIVIDFDFRFEKKSKERPITKSIAKDIVSKLTEILKDMFGNDINYDCFVLQRPHQYKKKELWTDGLHIQFPYVICEYTYQFILRNEFINTYDLTIECQNDMDNIYDKAVIKSNNWCMYGSTKQDIKPYELKWIFNTESKIEDFSTLKLVKLLSIRNKSEESVELINDRYNKKDEAKQLRNHNVLDYQNIEVTNQEYNEVFIGKLLNMLSKRRVTEYMYWYRIICSLHNCCQTDNNSDIDYLAIAHQWSRTNHTKYDRIELNDFWKYLTNNKKKYYTLGTLHHYAKKDNPEEYQKMKISSYLNVRKDSFPSIKIDIIQVTHKTNMCIVELDKTVCPFKEKAKHDLYFKASTDGLMLFCKNCLGECKSFPISNKALSNVFGMNLSKDTELKWKSTDDILLMNESLYISNKKEINSRYIEDEIIEEIRRHDTIIIFSPTGTGKTTTIEKLSSDIDEKTRILSIVSRRSMAATHVTSFKSLEMTCYLDDKDSINLNRYIISLEQLHSVKRKYDILILDEITSLILHFYSPTMKSSRLRSFVKLVDLVRHCDKIIVCDAFITDMALDFITFLRQGKDIVYLRNRFRNKRGVNMMIYMRQHNTINKELELFCGLIINRIKRGEPVMIMSDSKTIINNIYYYLSKFTRNKDYFRIYTKDSGSFEELKNCNKKWKNRCILFSPKIIYGLDVLIEYDVIYAIYKGQTIESSLMVQQISRARNA
ncbi:MAG TPA: PriCT-2 domain-containing protein, partial [Aquella sp.]|nr:PriCT-2 domain-containing protein [Aquella sp.]